MSWVNMDDQFPDHKKVAGLSDGAFRLHVAGICYCARHLTDGLIEAEEVPRLVRKYRKSSLDELIERGIWKAATIECAPVAYEIHDYLQWNDSRETVLERRERAKDRAKKSRSDVQ